ncbi:DNA gyrase subunit A, partial [Patescibacteria group bacterium]|nr:DNA gyrase subunit A [Patescibacteria group bacterium]
MEDIGIVKPRKIVEEMQESYLDYAMSVIVSRALPDVRDGLKPVHRRILYAMWSLGLKSGGKFRKSATVVGEVLGKYHPHGDVAVYDALARMAQDFSMRYPLVDGQGNFGSMDGDSPAAMRYTEAKLEKISEELLVNIEKNTVDFVDNYDRSQQEPSVLPAKLPNALLNGAVGIAVGMATNIPPHNLTELIDGINHLIDNPKCTLEDLMQFVKGPDFPTGGLIFNRKDITEAYATGKGGIVMRAKTDIVEAQKGSFNIIVNEVPYQVNKATLITKIADLVKDKKIDGIKDIRDESDKDGVRIVIELKREAFPKKVLNKLFSLTQLQEKFHVNLLALANGIQPQVMNLKQILEHYIEHRKIVIVRRTQFELDKAKAREHILEGLKKALDHIDEIIATIKKSKDRDIAHQ